MTQVSTPGIAAARRSGALKLVLHRETVSYLTGGAERGRNAVDKNPTHGHTCGSSCGGTCCTCGCLSTVPTGCCLGTGF